MALPTMPPPVDLSPETKKAIIDGLKKVIEILQVQKAIDPTWSYQDIIHDPDALGAFIQAYRDNRAAADPVVATADGQPVRDDVTPLVCGVTLDQIQQLLVRTCAKHYFESHREEEVVTETKKVKRFLFFTRTEEVQRKAVTTDDRKNREILNYIAFDWQLPLLPAFLHNFTYPQVQELGQDLICLRTAEAIAAVAQFDPPLLKKAKSSAGKDFAAILAYRPEAIAGIAFWSPDWYVFFRQVLKQRAWDFFSREKSFFNAVAELDKPTARVYGEVLCYIASDNLIEMQRLNIDKVGVLLDSLKGAFGAQAEDVLAVPAFAKDMLRKLVESLIHMNQEKDQLAVSCQLTCKALVPQIQEWLDRQRAA